MFVVQRDPRRLHDARRGGADQRNGIEHGARHAELLGMGAGLDMVRLGHVQTDADIRHARNLDLPQALVRVLQVRVVHHPVDGQRDQRLALRNAKPAPARMADLANDAAFSAGAVAWLQKPISNETLEAQLTNILGTIPEAPGLEDLDELYPGDRVKPEADEGPMLPGLPLPLPMPVGELPLPLPELVVAEVAVPVKKKSRKKLVLFLFVLSAAAAGAAYGLGYIPL